MARTGAGRFQVFTVTLGREPGTNRGGVVAYAHFAPGKLILTRMWHGPLDEAPEFLEATRADADGHGQHCFNRDPSKQKNLGSCTMTLEK